MYRGELMEEAPAADLYRTAAHPYTQLLFSSILSGNEKESCGIKGEVRTALEETRGCAFAERCPRAKGRCFREKPELLETSPDHRLRCHNA
jgi:oligopeptide/dipeptide ABC transporter ATP-binding protein